MSQSNSTEIQYSLTMNTANASGQIEKLETSIMRVLQVVKLMSGGDERLSAFITSMQQTITTIRALQLAIRALQLASGPIGWAYAATSFVAVGLTAAPTLEGYNNLASQGV